MSGQSSPVQSEAKIRPTKVRAGGMVYSLAPCRAAPSWVALFLAHNLHVSVEGESVKRIRMRCEEILGKELEPGDLFSTAGPEVWDHVDDDPYIIGEKVYIRTNATADKAKDGHLPIFRIHIEELADNKEAHNG